MGESRVSQADLHPAESRVKRMADHGIKWAAIGSIWQESKSSKWINQPAQVLALIELLVAHKISPWIWGYPWKGQHEEFVDAMDSVSPPDVVGWLIDAELGEKDEDSEKARSSARDLVQRSIGKNPYRSYALTSYGIPQGHPTFPWEGFFEEGGFFPLDECSFFVPQLYELPTKDIRRGLEYCRKIGVDYIVPAFGTYKNLGHDNTPTMTPEQLDAHFGDFFSVKDEFHIEALIGWSESQVRPQAWEIIERYASMI